MNWEKFRVHFHNSWHDKIRPFIESVECDEIYKQLKTSEEEIYPYSLDLWKAFKYTSYNTLKCIIIGQCPYHTSSDGRPFSDGLAFSCSMVHKLSPSLRVLYEAMCDDLDNKRINKNPDLHYLAFQDVLLLNLSLTIDKGNKDSFDKHEILWRPFIKYLFENVLNTVTGTPILIFGKPAEEQILPYLDENSQLYKCMYHPAYFARKEEPMEHQNCFSWTNDILKKNNLEQVYWNYDDYLEKGLPF